MKKVTFEVEVEFEVPDEANWIAFDGIGQVYWFVEKPQKRPRLKRWDPAYFGASYGCLGTAPVTEWENSLREVYF